MKPFVLDPSMTTMAGIFYPSGHIFATFPNEACVRNAVAALEAAGHLGDTAHADPETILEQIVRTLGSADAPLPSVGADGDMVRRIADQAGSGHHGLLIKVEKKDSVETIVSAIKSAGASAALYYRTFIIEDLIAPPKPTDGPQSVTVGTRAASPDPGDT